MLLVRSTVMLYRDSGLDAARATARSAWALVLLLLLFPLISVVAIAVSPLGMIGGFVVGLLNMACAGTYLATLQDALDSRRSLSLSTIRGNFGRYTSEVIGVAFPIWIGTMIAGLVLPGGAVALLLLGVALVFNAAPEMIGRTRGRGTEVLMDAARWLKENGPEWFVPQVLLLLPLLAFRPNDALEILSMFGPQFGFVNAGGLALSSGLSGGPVSWAIGLGLVAFVHVIMLFRSALFVRLGRGGRRQREWKARIGG